MRTRSIASGLAALTLLAAALSCQNINVDTEKVDPCTFDHGTGKYSAPFDLEIENDDPAVEIWYTDDGTIPSDGGGTSQLYNDVDKVPIDQTTTIRAKGYKAGLRASDERSATFTFVWAQGTDMPGGVNFFGRSIFGCTELDGKIYCIGGLEKTVSSTTAVKTVLVYDPASGIWTTAPDISSERQGVEAVTYGGKIYIIGGAEATIGDPVAIVEEFDPAANEGDGAWATKTSMPTARNNLKLAVLGTKIYAFGGVNGSYLDTVEEFDPAGAGGAGSWTTKASMPTAAMSFGLGVAGGKAYLFGGFTSSGSSIVQVYDPGSDTWDTATAMLSGRNGAQAIAHGGMIFLIGGTNDLGNTISTVESFDPLAAGGDGAWATKTSMPRARGNFGIAADSEHVYAISGLAFPGPAYNKYVDIYEPSADD